MSTTRRFPSYSSSSKTGRSKCAHFLGFEPFEFAPCSTSFSRLKHDTQIVCARTSRNGLMLRSAREYVRPQRTHPPTGMNRP